ncbi:DUF7713 domain-containing protein [Paraburkholderia diazotrophica]
MCDLCDGRRVDWTDFVAMLMAFEGAVPDRTDGSERRGMRRTCR